MNIIWQVKQVYTQLRLVDKADDAATEIAGIGVNNDVNALASGIEAAIGGAYDAAGLTVPQGFKGHKWW